MAISDRLKKRFRNTPGVSADDIADWIAEAEAESGLTEGEAENTDTALLYLALAIGCEAIAIDASRFFKYTDADESVDKTMIADNYTRIASWSRRMYSRYRLGLSGASMSTPARADGR